MNDVFYQLQAIVFGNELSFLTVLKKILVDQFIYSPFVIGVYLVTLQLWRENRWNLWKALGCWNRELCEKRWLPLVVAAWFYWIPMVACLYSMPSDLQFMFFVAACAAWSLVLMFILEPEKA